ncbi:MAG: recombination mediator RecR [Candidatus Falkowbacteria bacterium]|nr:recombination mediator RecR [Candidatus Falkowbacteria bacterium]
MKLPSSIQNLINEFMKLPTIGPKTAERFVFYLLQQNPEELQKFAQAIAELKEKIVICQTCLAVADSNPCQICSNKNRDATTLCVVANTRDLIALEKTNEYKGLYLVLGGVINTIAGIGPESLKTNELVNRLRTGKIKEVILAFDPNFEGEATALYLVKQLKPLKIKLTRIAKGLPVGADLEYADDITLGNALKYRNEIK